MAGLDLVFAPPRALWHPECEPHRQDVEQLEHLDGLQLNAKQKDGGEEACPPETSCLLQQLQAQIPTFGGLIT